MADRKAADHDASSIWGTVYSSSFPCNFIADKPRELECQDTSCFT